MVWIAAFWVVTKMDHIHAAGYWPFVNLIRNAVRIHHRAPCTKYTVSSRMLCSIQRPAKIIGSFYNPLQVA